MFRQRLCILYKSLTSALTHSASALYMTAENPNCILKFFLSISVFSESETKIPQTFPYTGSVSNPSRLLSGTCLRIVTMASSVFRQSSDPLGSIKYILQNYPYSSALLRELLQNSDDAKATIQV